MHLFMSPTSKLENCYCHNDTYTLNRIRYLSNATVLPSALQLDEVVPVWCSPEDPCKESLLRLGSHALNKLFENTYQLHQPWIPENANRNNLFDKKFKSSLKSYTTRIPSRKRQQWVHFVIYIFVNENHPMHIKWSTCWNKKKIVYFIKDIVCQGTRTNIYVLNEHSKSLHIDVLSSSFLIIVRL